MFEFIDGRLTYRTTEDTSLPVVLVDDEKMIPLHSPKIPTSTPKMGWLLKFPRRAFLKQVKCDLDTCTQHELALNICTCSARE